MAQQVFQYFGRKTSFKGKTLWEIVGNLRGGGIGRIFTRSMFERYPEPTYYKIVKVEPTVFEKPRKVKVWVEKTFRGKKYPHVLFMHGSSYKADFRLIPKEEEKAYCREGPEINIVREISPHLELPPLLKDMLLKEMAKNNIEPPEIFAASIRVKNSPNSVAKLNRSSTKLMPIGIGIPDRPLYKNVKPIELNA